MLGDFIKPSENSLTAAVFSHLLHLPSELCWQLLRGACFSASLPTAAGELQSADFRPKWDPTGTANSSYVEPDLFLRFADFDLIVEAKRWDQSKQSPQQWKNEVRAYWNEHLGDEASSTAGPTLRLIALGGILTTQDQEASVEVPRISPRRGTDAGKARNVRFSCRSTWLGGVVSSASASGCCGSVAGTLSFLAGPRARAHPHTPGRAFRHTRFPDGPLV